MITKERLRIREYVILNWQHAFLTTEEFNELKNVLSTLPYHIYKTDGLYKTFHIYRTDGAYNTFRYGTKGNKVIISVSEMDDRKIREFFDFWLNNKFAQEYVFDEAIYVLNDDLKNNLIKFVKHCKSDNAIMYCCGNYTYLFFDLNEIMK